MIKIVSAYDIETYEENNIYIPYCVCVLIEKFEKSFYDKKVVLRSILWIYTKIIPNQTIIIYVHNLDFDGFLILEEITKIKKMEIKFLVHKMKIYYLKIIFSNRIIEFRCSKKILPASLANIAKDFKLPHKMMYPYTFINKNNLYYCGALMHENVYWEHIDIKNYTIKYCFRDVEITSKFIFILANILKKEQNINILDNLSASSLALNIFRLNFNTKKICLNLNKKWDSVIREGYFGGRVEIFGNTEKEVYHYDFPGMYGMCMTEKFSYGDPHYIHPSTIDIYDLQPGFYSITWESHDIRIPVLPVKNEYGKLIFPNGEHSGIYWFEEIIAFKKSGGTIVKIYYGIVFDNFDYVFTNFVEYFNRFREKGGVYKTLGKLIINSLYGKLGSDIKKSKYMIAYTKNEVDSIAKKNKVLNLIVLNNIYIVEIRSSENQKGVNVAIAAAVTSKARVRLHNRIIETEKNGGRILYCDTDSLFIEFKEKPYLGFFDWSKKDSKFLGAVFALPKTYALLTTSNESLVKIKGIPKSSISFNDFKEKFYAGDFLLFKESFQTKKSNFTLRSARLDKKINLNTYDKRIFDENKEDTHV